MRDNFFKNSSRLFYGFYEEAVSILGNNKIDTGNGNFKEFSRKLLGDW